MYTFNKIENSGTKYDFCLKLSIDERTKSRLIKNDDEGNEIAIVLPRGYILRGGTVLSGEHSKKLLIIAKDESVSTVKAKNANKFLADGNKVKVSLKFKGREVKFLDKGKETVLKFVSMLSEGQLDKEPKLEGKFLNVIVLPKQSK